MAALQTSNAYLVEPADAADQISPLPVRTGLLALTLSLILGVGLAFLYETLDTRVRSADEIATRLGLPQLARIPAPRRKISKKNGLVTIEEPNSANAEAFRILRTNLDFVDLDRQARMIMVTSAVEGEGKSTTAANLAVTLARSGRRVVLVDLDTRRPFLHEFFGLEREDGLTRVALGYSELDVALKRVALSNDSQQQADGNEQQRSGQGRRRARCPPAGSTSAQPGRVRLRAQLSPASCNPSGSGPMSS